MGYPGKECRVCAVKKTVQGGLIYSAKKGRFEAIAWRGHTSVQNHRPLAPSPVEERT